MLMTGPSFAFGKCPPGSITEDKPMGAPSRSHRGRASSESFAALMIAATRPGLQVVAGRRSSKVPSGTTNKRSRALRSTQRGDSGGGAFRGSVPQQSVKFLKRSSKLRASSKNSRNTAPLTTTKANDLPDQQGYAYLQWRLRLPLPDVLWHCLVRVLEGDAGELYLQHGGSRSPLRTAGWASAAKPLESP